ncbi:hypothetical protein [Leptospira santarosai]|uniref:hypothetical protein n=1 Tax=Leptospira santarosai TaxID=28183 RepID=UPI0002982C3E|nr:hypothetical protein [Leptospira santarosai]EKS09929.1 hypothetical protein LEP1GSC071_2395 [Leptospira santarosai str. JET]MDI7224158.1 hypothetical protein [Leptospira santarosai]MDI7237288.1 hypothetical protein [Leptospira santarosai]
MGNVGSLGLFCESIEKLKKKNNKKNAKHRSKLGKRIRFRVLHFMADRNSRTWTTAVEAAASLDFYF